MSKNPKFTNDLVHESSLYLKQHAHNPVNWVAWSPEVFEKAKQEDKLVLISIGYSSCHWCHVMEKNCFENEDLAGIMNQHFICVKVDREERPDVDQVYMEAVQMMRQNGGWPLNCFVLPDGKPVFGGTYFPPKQWEQILNELAIGYQNNKDKFIEYGNSITKGIQENKLVKEGLDVPFKKELLHEMVAKWKHYFDPIYGGDNKFPKFPLANNLEFLLRYAYHTKDEKVTAHVKLSLDNIANGGIYDQIGGGITRYSTDQEWKVPHFEKMLYDNGQILKVFSLAYSATQNDLYKERLLDTITFLNREMKSPEGAFYTALDADSEGEEGKFYTWTLDEVKTVVGEDFNVVADYFSFNENGHWEFDNYIPLISIKKEDLLQKHSLSESEFNKIITTAKNRLLENRNKRVRPGLDDKILCSWNGLLLSGLSYAYRVLNDEEVLKSAQNLALFMLKHFKNDNNGLFHNYINGKASINGFLEDFCFFSEGLIDLYEVDGNQKWLIEAQSLVEYAIKHFYDSESGMFYYTSMISESLISRKTEFTDNVIPSSNSSMAKVLYNLSIHLENEEYGEKSLQMIKNMENFFTTYPSAYSNWANLACNLVFPKYEMVVIGKKAKQIQKTIQNKFLPQVNFAISEQESNLALLQNRFVNDKTLIYVCENKSCKLPTESVDQALTQIRSYD